MGDHLNVEDILAEEDDPGFISIVIGVATNLVSSYGWYILAGVVAIYFLWRNYGPKQDQGRNNAQNRPLSQQQLNEFQAKEEARLKRVADLQQKYNSEAVVRAEKVKQMEEDKRKARLAELEKLSTGNKLGDGSSSTPAPGNSRRAKNNSKSDSLRPEYNPLMGDTSSSRSCFQRPGGRSGG